MKINKFIYVMFCICMFFCGCITTPSFVNVQRKDNSEPLKLGMVVHHFNDQTNFCVEQVLNNKSFELDNDYNNVQDVSQMVLVVAKDENLYIDNRYMEAFIIPSKGGIYSNGQSIANGYYKYLGNLTYETVGRNQNGSSKYNTVRVFSEVNSPTDYIK